MQATPLRDCDPHHHRADGKEISPVEVEVRCTLQVPLQTSIIDGLSAFGMDPQAIIEEAIRSEVEEKLVVPLSGTEVPIRWVDASSSSVSIEENSGENKKEEKIPSSNDAPFHGCQNVVNKKAIVDLTVSQLGVQAHLLRDNFLYHLMNQIGALNRLLHYADEASDLGISLHHLSPSPSAHPGWSATRGEIRNGKNQEEEKKGAEDQIGTLLSPTIVSHSMKKTWQDAKLLTDELLKEIIEYKRKQRELGGSAAASTTTTSAPSSSLGIRPPCFFGTSSRNTMEKQKECAIHTQGESSERKLDERRVAGWMRNETVSKSDGHRLLLSKGCFTMEDTEQEEEQESSKVLWREERKVKCFEDEQVYAHGPKLPFLDSGSKSRSTNSGCSAKNKRDDAVVSGYPIEEDDGEDSEYGAEYRAMGYMRL